MRFSITKSYVIILATIVVLIIAGQWLISSNLQTVALEGNLINLSGRQRMISQKLVKDLALSSVSGVSAMHAFRSDLESFEQVHSALILGDESLGLNPLTDQALLAQYKLVADKFDPFIAVLSNIEKKGFAISELTKLNEIQSHFLIEMDAFVYLASANLQDDLFRFKILELAIAAVSFFLILLEVLFIFLPAYRRIQFQNEQLKVMAFQHSHVIRRPLSNILSLLYLLSKSDFRADDKYKLSLIEKEAIEIDRIVRDEVQKAELET